MRKMFGFFKKSTAPPLIEPSAAGGRRKHYKRRFTAARVDRLAADWQFSAAPLNDDLKNQLPTLRSRSRDLEQNNEIARRFLQLVESHVVGSRGFRLQVDGLLRNGKPDRTNNQMIERHFHAWSEKGVCDLSGRYSFQDIERLLMRTTARDGEMLVRFYDDLPTRENPYGFAVEILDPARIDTQKNIDLSNGNKVRLGIELDPSGRPVAYWLYSGEIKNDFGQTGERVPADDIVHDFISDRPEQLRGFPWMSGVMFDIHMLDAYQEAAVTAARIGASKMGFYKTPDGTLDALADDEIDGEFVSDADPGHFSPLPPGYDFQAFNPDYPHQMYAEFTSTVQRSIAAGLGISYHALTGDLTAVNFSSIRSGTLEERERWMLLQDWFIAAFLKPVYLRWLGRALDVGAISSPMSEADAYQRYRQHHWQGRRWPWVDPLKDINSIIAAIGAGLKSPQVAAAELGVDVEDVLDEIARFNEMAAEKGVTVNFGQHNEQNNPNS